MKKRLEKLKKWLFKKNKKGVSPVTVIFYVALAAILGATVVSSFTSALRKTNLGAVQDDMRLLEESLSMHLFSNPAEGRLLDKAGTFSDLIRSINIDMDPTLRFEESAVSESQSTSGGVTYTSQLRDPWGNPYGIYIFTNTHKDAFNISDGAEPTSTDTIMYIAIVSAGNNGVGGPMGVDGSNTVENFDSSKMVLNTDGTDDCGMIIRVWNNSIASAIFGPDNSTLGSLTDIQWVLGASPTGAPLNGEYFDFEAGTAPSAAPTQAGSIDQYYDKSVIVGEIEGSIR